MFAFSEYSHRNSNCLVPSLTGPDFNIRSEIAKLEAAIKAQPNNPENYFNLADIFLWECYWLRATIDLLEKALILQPQNTYYRWLLIDTRYRFPNPRPNAEHFEKLIKYDPQNLKIYTNYSRHCWDYTMQHRKAIKLLRKAKKIENKFFYGNAVYKWYLNHFKENYWNQLHLDRSKLFRAANYFYIFYWNWLTACIIITPILLTASLVAYKVLSKRKSDSARNYSHSKTKRRIPNAAIYI
jgi:tetratricopeptide (TPR) repeat protein